MHRLLFRSARTVSACHARSVFAQSAFPLRPSTFHQVRLFSAPADAVVTASSSTTDGSGTPSVNKLGFHVETSAPSLEQPDAPKYTGTLWFDNLYPIRVHRLDFRWVFGWYSYSRTLPRLLPDHIAILRVRPSLKEGGCLVDFESTEPVEVVEKEVIDHLIAEETHVWLSRSEVRAHLVKGVPFIEDIMNKYPSPRIRIDFQGPEVPMDALYNAIRPYGKIRDIVYSPWAKDTPRYAIVSFKHIHGAVSTKNCFHGQTIGSTKISVSYDQILKTSTIRSWMDKHPRLMIPFIALLFAAGTYLIFDPMRTFFIKNKITNRFDPQNFPGVQWVKAEFKWLSDVTLGKLIQQRSDKEGEYIGTWSEKEAEAKIKTHLERTPEALLLVTGAKGSGKSALVQNAAAAKRVKIILDMERLLSRTNDEFVNALAQAVGFFPAFTVLGYFTAMTDALVGAGAKTAAASNQNNVMKILECLTYALTSVSSKYANPSMPLEEREYPIIIVDGFNNQNKGKQDKFFETLVDWASLLVENHVAHVLFVADHTFVEEAMNKVLLDKRVETIALNDANFHTSTEYIKQSLHADQLDPTTLSAVDILGGRFVDVRTFITKLHSGMSPEDALDSIIRNSIVTIRTQGLGEGTEEGKKLPWSKVQFWTIILKLAKEAEVNFDEIQFSQFFKGDDGPLRALSRTEMISIAERDGKKMIVPGKPVFRTAFRKMAADPKLSGGMGVLIKKAQIEEEQNKINNFERELSSLKDLQMSSWAGALDPSQLKARKQFLLDLLKESHEKVAVFDQERRAFEALVKAPSSSASAQASAQGGVAK